MASTTRVLVLFKPTADGNIKYSELNSSKHFPEFNLIYTVKSQFYTLTDGRN
jgi:hypothetical protein